MVMFPSSCIRMQYRPGTPKDDIIQSLGKPWKTIHVSPGSEQLIYVKRGLLGSYQLVGSFREDHLEEWTVEGL
jgi:hypothetical protein